VNKHSDPDQTTPPHGPPGVTRHEISRHRSPSLPPSVASPESKQRVSHRPTYRRFSARNKAVVGCSGALFCVPSIEG
jgi:hypothetical protein